MRKHTPGPWFTVNRYSGGLSVIDQRGFEHIDAKFFAPVFEVCPEKLSFPHWSDRSDSAYLEISDEEQAANARLIAAAPELLEALREIEAFMGADFDDLPSASKARAAIAKAEGKL